MSAPTPAQPIVLRVTQEHIDEGERENANSCAIALAVREQIPGVDPGSVEIDGNICFEIDGVSYSFYNSEVSDFIEVFDANGDRPPPRDFVLGSLEDGLSDDFYDEPEGVEL